MKYPPNSGGDPTFSRQELAAIIGNRPPSVRELHDRIRDFSTRFPRLCRLTKAGKSRLGNELELLSVSGGPYEIFVIGDPHNDEPVGRATAFALAHQVVTRAELRADVTWHILASSDPDGAMLNDRWVTANATPTWDSYFRGLYRAALADQPEWTFPCPGFNAPLPETQTMMSIIDGFKPGLFEVVSLHNCMAGGAFYITPNKDARLVDLLARTAGRWRFTVGSTSIDTVGLESAGPGVYVLDPADRSVPGAAATDRRPCGASSIQYAHRHGGLGIAPEVPMWRTRPQVLPARKRAEALDRAAETLHDVLDRIRRYQVRASPFGPAVNDTLAIISGVTAWLRQNPDEPSPHDSPFKLSARAAGMLLRDIDIQLEAERHPVLLEERDRLDRELTAWLRGAEEEFRPVAVSIAQAVGFQLDTIVSSMRLFTGA
ncbi:M14 family zinc carboxypeptidase [Actinoallomurus sp. NBC_01490]|uniref:M14 family zinc carboxypeptidase n=1 Tax=Actinoallomurus sp. NBC_01490 TaxID=2903557 RepID=UPI002E314146|nr:M14 family zinc carboxypeptidase [Actinoallomurus sp. NBC_01490]